MEIWSTVQCRKGDTDEFELDDHDVSLSRSWKVLIRSIVESSGRDP